MQTNQTSFISKLRGNYSLLLFLTCTVLWLIPFSPVMSSRGLAPSNDSISFIGIIIGWFIISAIFSGLSMVLYILMNSKHGCYIIVGLGIIPPLVAAIPIWIAHWITSKIYTGDREDIPPYYRYITDEPEKTVEQSPSAPQEATLDLSPKPTPNISVPTPLQQIVDPKIQSPEKTCPKCAEKILLEASVCRYCGHQFNETEVVEAQKDFQARVERDKADADIREQQTKTLIRVRDLHNNVAKAKSKANAWILPLLFGGGIGTFACIIVAIALVFIVPMVSGSSVPTAIPGCSGLVVLILAWIGATFWFRHNAKEKSSLLVEDEEDVLKEAVEEIAKSYTEWVSEIGGTETLLDLQKVKSLLATYSS